MCGSISWIRSLLGITTEEHAPLFNLLRGNEELNSPRTLTEEARHSIEKVQWALSSRPAHRYHPDLPFQFVALGPHLHGLIFQWNKGQRDPLLITEWVFLSLCFSKSITTPLKLMAQLIIKARAHLCTLAECDIICIYLPLTTRTLEHLLQYNENLFYALDSYSGQISIHYPKHKLFNAAFYLIPKEIQSRKPLKAVTIFTDGSGASHKSVMTWRDPQTQSLMFRW